MSICPEGKINCNCTYDYTKETNFGVVYKLKEVTDEIGKTLGCTERAVAIEMVQKGFTTRQIICKVKEIAAIEYANKRRVQYIKKMKQLGTGPLIGSEVEKFKKQIDKEQGKDKEWEELGYPAYYRSGLLEDIAAQKKKKPAKKQTKSKKKKAATKATNSMNEVD